MVNVFHIGLHKTGTTFFQKSVFNNIKDISYYNVFKEGELYRYLITNDYIYNKTINKKFNYKGTNLFSCEEFSGRVDVNSINLSNILNNINYYFDDVKISFFIRRQDKFALSNYLQAVKGGQTLSLKSFYHFIFSSFRIRMSPYINISSFLYLFYIDYICKLFGKKNLLLIPYEEFCESPYFVIKKMCDFIGCNVPMYKNEKVNAKFGYYRVLIFRFLIYFRF